MLDTVIKNATIVDGQCGSPYLGDIGIVDGLIVEIGTVQTPAEKSIDAEGCIAAPGWIDIHTHYDGQVSWDDQLDPSASHGVTTIVMGNCGVGFAPVRPGDENCLIELMEGVEDIPGTALHEGIEWGRWETFPEYLNYLESRRYAMDVGALIPHSAVRNYVMGSRAIDHQQATQNDIVEMCRHVEESMKAGALGFATSRTVAHKSSNGVTLPGTFADRRELLGIAETMKKVGKGVLQAVPAGVIGDIAGPEASTTLEEVELFAELAKVSRRKVTFTLQQNLDHPTLWKSVLDKVSLLNEDEATSIYPQVASRPVSIVSSIRTYHMFQRRKTFLRLAEELPFDELIVQLKREDVKNAILNETDVPSEKPGAIENLHALLGATAAGMFPMVPPISYEPESVESFGALAAQAGVSVQSYMYDFLLENGGGNFAVLMGANYIDGNFDVIEKLLKHEHSVFGLSDAGAHVNLIFDAVMPTFQLMHWVRDRVRGNKLPLEFVVHRQTKRNAELFGMTDRGSIELGKRADINVIDLQNLNLRPLEIVTDLPAGGSRILQKADGYRYTFVSGVMTRKGDTDTGERPGRLVRGSHGHH